MVLISKFLLFMHGLLGATRVVVSDAMEEEDDGYESATGSMMSSGGGLEIEGETCCVCLCCLDREEELKVLPCLHRFHKRCIERWLDGGGRKSCPLCRFSMGNGERFCDKEVLLTAEMVIWFSSFHGAGF